MYTNNTDTKRDRIMTISMSRCTRGTVASLHFLMSFNQTNSPPKTDFPLE